MTVQCPGSIPQKLLSILSEPMSLIARRRRLRFVVLGYHMVAGRYDSDFDIAPCRFEQQMEYLARHARVLSLSRALEHAHLAPNAGYPIVVVTFDDAYRDFYTTVYPIMRRLRLPSILFVPVGFVDDPARFRVSPVAGGESRPEPCTWPMLREMQASGFVEIGSHSHSHEIIPTLDSAAQHQELGESRRHLEQRLGCHVTSFAWPYGYWSRESRGVACDHYRCLLRFAGGSVRSETVEPTAIPRIPIRASDSWQRFRRKCHGLCDGEEALRAAVRDGFWMLRGIRR